MGFLKQLIGGYLAGGHHKNNVGQHGNKHGYSGGERENFGMSSASDSTVCTKCKTLNSSNAKFCQQCGGSLIAFNCSQCNVSLSPGTKFCPQCGKEQTKD